MMMRSAASPPAGETPSDKCDNDVLCFMREELRWKNKKKCNPSESLKNSMFLYFIILQDNSLFHFTL